jgi:ribulose-5-phosphate 4-epimerase/fuculose-1-phosphate aldolase
MHPSITPPPDLAEKLVYANRILYDQGVVDGLGHVSMRHPGHEGVYLLSCNRAPGRVSRADIVCYDLDGQAVSQTQMRSYLERFIHGEIYRVRPDVHAVVHSHSPSVIPFGAVAQPLRPIFHMAGFLGEGTAQFDIREHAGDTDMLIRDAYLGQALARTLGSRSCVLMRGHGSTTVGMSLEQVVYRAIYAELNAKLQMHALGLGEVKYLNAREAELAAASIDTQIQRSWDLWQSRVGPIG